MRVHQIRVSLGSGREKRVNPRNLVFFHSFCNILKFGSGSDFENLGRIRSGSGSDVYAQFGSSQIRVDRNLTGPAYLPMSQSGPVGFAPGLWILLIPTIMKDPTPVEFN